MGMAAGFAWEAGWSVVAVVAIVVSIGVLLLGASAATANHKPKLFDFGSSGALGGQLSGARGIAINETGAGGVTSGTLYVAEIGNDRIQSFDADGGFIRAWGWDVIQSGKPGDTGTGFEICQVTSDCKAGTTGAGAGQLTNPAGGIAVSQATGDVYVIDRDNSRIQQFTATGAFVRAWGSSGSAAGQFSFSNAISGIGVDEDGNVYVADAGGNKRVQKFDSEGNFLRMGGWDVDSVNPSLGYEVCTIAANCKAGVAGAGTECQFNNDSALPSYLAASPSGDVYVVGRTDGTVYHLSSELACEGSLSATEGGGGHNRNALAVNAADGHLFFTRAGADTNIYELDPTTGLVVHTHPAEGNEWVGLAVNSVTGRIYATRTTAATFVRLFGEQLGPEAKLKEPPPPVVSNTGTRATLSGTVKPNGAELNQCKFQYGTTTAYGSEVPCAETFAEIGSGNDPVPVHADISGLRPNGTTYHVQLVAVNPKGEGKSADGIFTTPDTVVTQPAAGVTATEATLNGTIDPDTVAISECLFEWGTTTAYGNVAPCAESSGEIGTGTDPVSVHANISGLDPNGTTYHFRLVATYSGPIGGIAGDDASFETKGPVVVDSWAQEVTLTEAILKAEVNPKGSATTYRFEYGTQGPCSDPENSCAVAPVPDGSVGSDSSAHEVGELLEGLEPGTAYHWRVVATNPDAVSEGPDRVFNTYAPLSHKPCTNDSFRTGPSAGLPDCRAYEMVSPVDKGGGDIVVGVTVELDREGAYRKASVDGERVTYSSSTAFGDALRSTKSNQYLSSRDEDGWSTHALLPAQGVTVFDPGSSLAYDFNTNFQAFTPDLCFALMRDHSLVPLDPAAIAGFVNLYARDNCAPDAGTYEALVGEPPTFSSGKDLTLQGRTYSADLDHIIFAAFAALDSTPAPAPSTNGQIYDSVRTPTGRELHTVSVLPGGEANSVSSEVASGAATRDANLSRAVAMDGSRIFWSSGGQVYVRLNSGQPESAVKDGEGNCVPEAGRACTLEVSSGDNATFWTAATDGSKAIYSEGADLYEFDVDSQTRTLIAGQLGGVAGASEDLSRFYFTSREAIPGAGQNGAGDEALAGESNVYLRDGSEVRFVATAEGAGGIDSGPSIFRSSRVSADGRRLVFESSSRELAEAVADFDNTDLGTGAAAVEIYRYDAEVGGAGELLCVSCNPAGARPTGGTTTSPYRPGVLSGAGVAAWLPTCEWSNLCKRTLADDADRVLFNAFDALASEDTNKTQDVYQWEAPGTGTCTKADPRYFELNGGCVHLISTGKSKLNSGLLDASGSGADVFFTTASSIDLQDLGSIDVYDARAGGGFPPPPLPKPPCVGDACQVVPPAPEPPAPASADYEGPGDVKEGHPRCAKGKVRRKGRCVIKKNRKHARAHSRAANRSWRVER